MKSWVLNYEEKLAVSTCSYWDVTSIEDVVPRLSNFYFLNFITILKIFSGKYTGQLSHWSVKSYGQYYIYFVLHSLFFKPWNTVIFLFSPSFLSYSFLPKSNHFLVWSFSFSHSKIFLFSNSSKNKIVMKLLL